DTAKAAAFIYSICKDAGVKINKDDIYAGATRSRRSVAKPSFNVYIEDSESMDAYVKGNTRFKDAIYSLLGNVITVDTLTQGINLYYINNHITFSRQKADANTLLQFIQNLDPATFRTNGGDRSSSDMRHLLQQVLDSTDDRHVNLLVSDFVFSPGKGQNAIASLQQQSTGIKIAFGQKIEKFDLAIEVVQLHSNFSGKYFDENDKPIVLSADRPYYMWLIGSKEQINIIRKNGVLNNINGGVDNTLVFYKQTSPLLHGHKITFSHKTGDFELPDGASGNINAAKPNDVYNSFGFNLLVDYSKDIEDLSFFDDTNNYSHDGNYKLTISRLNDKTDPASSGFTHCLHLSTNNLQEQELHVFTQSKIPKWVAVSNSLDDRNIKNEPSQMSRTFGLQYLIEGLYDAFYVSPHQDKVTEVEINIKK
ncbi:MAG: hypothetical protein JWR09_679, partial [Mucilaginibacter sp.]|nr:hypothetical protein [Mucilaginibacter sp.]